MKLLSALVSFCVLSCSSFSIMNSGSSSYIYSLTYLARKNENIQDLYLSEGGSLKDKKGFFEFSRSIYDETLISGIPLGHVKWEGDSLAILANGLIEVRDLNKDGVIGKNNGWNDT